MNFKINHLKKSLLFIKPLLLPFPGVHFHAILMRRRRRRKEEEEEEEKEEEEEEDAKKR
jgi:cytochrome c-type biogenesis protein CcmH/NrfF